MLCFLFFFSSRRRHTRCSRDWSSDVCSSDLQQLPEEYLDLLREPYLKKDGRQAALLGIPLGSEEAGYTNSVVGWQPGQIQRSEERRVGKECRSRWSPYH